MCEDTYFLRAETVLDAGDVIDWYPVVGGDPYRGILIEVTDHEAMIHGYVAVNSNSVESITIDELEMAFSVAIADIDIMLIENPYCDSCFFSEVLGSCLAMIRKPGLTLAELGLDRKDRLPVAA